MKVWFKYLFALAFIGSLIGGGSYFMTRSFFRVKSVDITLGEHKDPSYLFEKTKSQLEMKLKPFLGQYVWSVDIERVLQIAESDRRVKDVFVTRVLPNGIKIIIEPHSAYANIMGSDSTAFYPLSPEGDLLPSVAAEEAADGPILRGEKFLKDEKLRAKAIELLQSLPETGSFSRNHVSEMYLDSKKGLAVVLKKSGIEVLMGLDNFKNRASYVSRVVQYLDSEQLTGRVIDARYSKKVVVKLRNEP
ncbi:MAG: cell division protein FtsQ/DivIB [Bdellovibrionota bacterium]